MSPSPIVEAPAGRVLVGGRNRWFLGPGGVARLGASQLTADGALVPTAERKLRDAGLLSHAAPKMYLLTVLTSTDCNLGCAYCFQNTAQDPKGGSRPPRIAHARLTSETITKALEFTGEQMAATGLEKLRILLFGGEPLLNPRGCLELLERAEDYGLATVHMISNGTLLTRPLAQRLYERKLRSIQVTFDGDRDDHDQIRVRRRTHGANGTFDAIVGNIARASSVAPFKWIARVNVSHHNQDGIDGLVERLAVSLDPAKLSIYFSRVGDVGIGYDNSLPHSRGLVDRFSGWQRRAIELGFDVPRPAGPVLCPTCGYGDGRYGAVVSADGSLSSCWETAGKPGWEVGSVDDGYLAEDVIRDRWISCESTYQFSEDERAIAAFQDAVDACLLDNLREAGKI